MSDAYDYDDDYDEDDLEPFDGLELQVDAVHREARLFGFEPDADPATDEGRRYAELCTLAERECGGSIVLAAARLGGAFEQRATPEPAPPASWADAKRAALARARDVEDGDLWRKPALSDDEMRDIEHEAAAASAAALNNTEA